MYKTNWRKFTVNFIACLTSFAAAGHVVAAFYGVAIVQAACALFFIWMTSHKEVR